jgi:hypothetical protein
MGFLLGAATPAQLGIARGERFARGIVNGIKRDARLAPIDSNYRRYWYNQLDVWTAGRAKWPRGLAT